MYYYDFIEGIMDSSGMVLKPILEKDGKFIIHRLESGNHKYEISNLIKLLNERAVCLFVRLRVFMTFKWVRLKFYLITIGI